MITKPVSFKSDPSKARSNLKAGYKQKTPIEKAKADPKSLRKAIDAKCWDCSMRQWAEVTHCQVFSCPLHSLRPRQNGV
jgi:hypothetical protein